MLCRSCRVGGSARCPFGRTSRPAPSGSHPVLLARPAGRVRHLASSAALQAHRCGSACRGGLMPTYLSPGVYVEEVESGSRPIEGVGTAVAAFVGLAAQGPLNEPILVTNWG